jgi:hypothetical protein
MTTEPQMLEAMARAMAAFIYNSEGLETMNYMGVDDYCNREWNHYVRQAQAVIAAMKPFVRGVVKNLINIQNEGDIVSNSYATDILASLPDCWK